MNGYIVARVVCTRVFVSLFLSAEHSKLNVRCFVFLPAVPRENVYAVKYCDNNRNVLIQCSKKMFGIVIEELRKIVNDRFVFRPLSLSKMIFLIR